MLKPNLGELKNSYTGRLLLGATILISLLFVMVMSFFYYQHHKSVRDVLSETFKASAEEVVSAISVDLKIQNIHAIQRILGHSFVVKHAKFTIVKNANGEEIISYPDSYSRLSPVQCDASFASKSVFFGRERIGSLEYCYSTVLPGENMAALLFLVPILLGIALWTFIFFAWIRGYSNRMQRFVNNLEKIDPESPVLSSVPAQDQKDGVVVNLYNKTNALLRRLEATATELRMKEKEASLAEMSRQVAHDIRSPLTALNMLLLSADEMPEDKRLLIRSSVQRINDIASRLLKHSKKPTDAKSSVMLAGLIESIVSEKRIQLKNKNLIELRSQIKKGFGLFSVVNPTELTRAISNLVNNSVEAIGGSGNVLVTLASVDGQNCITIKDDGGGIPPHILNKIGESGISFGKDGQQSGFGLGIPHAIKTVKDIGGTFSISSKQGLGTTVTIMLPVANPPDWFVNGIIVNPGQNVVSIDDDESIHEVWARKFAYKGISVKHFRFLDLNTFREWCSMFAEEPCQFLVDYEFVGQTQNGLDLIEELDLKGRAILVTSRYDEAAVQERAKSLDVKMLPKMLAPIMPIKSFARLDLAVDFR